MKNLKTFIEPALSKEWWTSILCIILGSAIMALGFNLFISPYKIVPGGVYGLGIILHNLFPSIQVGTFGYMLDIPLLLSAVIVFGRHFAGRTLFAALLTPGLMNIFDRLFYPTPEAMESLDPSQLLGGSIDLSNDLILAAIMGGVLVGLGVGIVVRNRATTGGTDIIAMYLQKFAGMKFAHGMLLTDSIVVLFGLIVIGFGIFEPAETITEGGNWLLSLYSLVTIYVSSQVLAYVIDGASYDKLLFIISENHSEELRQFIINDLDRSATYIKASGMYTNHEKEMVFLVVRRQEVSLVQHLVKEVDPRAFFVVTDAYDTFGEGFKPFPEKSEFNE